MPVRKIDLYRIVLFFSSNLGLLPMPADHQSYRFWICCMSQFKFFSETSALLTIIWLLEFSLSELLPRHCWAYCHPVALDTYCTVELYNGTAVPIIDVRTYGMKFSVYRPTTTQCWYCPALVVTCDSQSCWVIRSIITKRTSVSFMLRHRHFWR